MPEILVTLLTKFPIFWLMVLDPSTNGMQKYMSNKG
jgi:hypothetical protein